MFNLTPTALKDVAERAIRTFVGVVVPLLLAGLASDHGALGTMAFWQNLAIGGLSAAGTVVLAFVLAAMGPKNGTTSLVRDVIDAQVVRALDQPVPGPGA